MDVEIEYLEKEKKSNGKKDRKNENKTFRSIARTTKIRTVASNYIY